MPPSQRAEPTVTQMRKDVFPRVSHASISKGRAHSNTDEEGRVLPVSHASISKGRAHGNTNEEGCVPTGQPCLHLKGQSPR